MEENGQDSWASRVKKFKNQLRKKGIVTPKTDGIKYTPDNGKTYFFFKNEDKLNAHIKLHKSEIIYKFTNIIKESAMKISKFQKEYKIKRKRITTLNANEMQAMKDLHSAILEVCNKFNKKLRYVDFNSFIDTAIISVDTLNIAEETAKKIKEETDIWNARLKRKMLDGEGFLTEKEITEIFRKLYKDLYSEHFARIESLNIK